MSSLKRRLGTTVPLLLGTCALVGAVAACGDDDDAQPKPDGGASSSSSSGGGNADGGGDGGPQDQTFPQFVRSTIEKSTNDTSSPIPFGDVEKVKEGKNDDSELTVFSGFF